MQNQQQGQFRPPKQPQQPFSGGGGGGGGQGACVNLCKPTCHVEKAPNWKRWVSEFVATYTLLFIIFSVSDQTSDLLTNALGQGLALYVVSSVFTLSSQMNGIFTVLALALGLRPKINVLTMIINLVLQALAAWLAGMTRWFFAPSSTALGITTLAPGVSVGQGFLAEFLAAFIVLAAAVLITGNYYKPGNEGKMYNNGNLVVGISLSLAVMVAGAVSGAAVNPWRHFGVAVIVGFESFSWIYYVAPLTAGIAVWIMFRFVFKDRIVRRV